MPVLEKIQSTYGFDKPVVVADATLLSTDISPKRAAELTQNMYELEYAAPDSGEIRRRILKMDAEQQSVYDTIHRS